MNKGYLLRCAWPDEKGKDWSLLIFGRRSEDPYTYHLKVGRIKRATPTPEIRVVPHADHYALARVDEPSIAYDPGPRLLHAAVSSVSSEWLWTGGLRLNSQFHPPFDEHLYDILKRMDHITDIVTQMAYDCAPKIDVTAGEFIRCVLSALKRVDPGYASRLAESLPRDLFKNLMDQPTVLDDHCMILLEQIDDIDYCAFVIGGHHEEVEAYRVGDKQRAEEVRRLRRDWNNPIEGLGLLELDRVRLRHEFAYACKLLFMYPAASVPRTGSWHMTLGYEEMWHLSRVPLAIEAFSDIRERDYAEPIITRYKNEAKARRP